MNRLARWLICYFAIAGAPCLAGEWTRFRGPNGSGLADGGKPPLSWSAASGENIAWSADLPGRGISSPIVTGGRVVLTASSGYRHDRLHVLCFSEADGKKLWERQFWATGRTMTHPFISPASPTPAAAEGKIYVAFSTNDIVCLDLDGNVLWLRGLMLDFPNASNSLGLASSPIVVDGALVMKIETDSQSLAAGLDAETGKTLWSIERPKIGAWTSPVVVPGENGTPAVVLQSATRATAHDPKSGEELWRFDQGCDSISSCAASGDVLYMPSQGLAALKTPSDAKSPEVLWTNNRLAPSTPTLLVDGDRLYVMNGSVLKCAETSSGEILWQLRVKGNFSGSPVAAGGLIYMVNEEGLGQVIEPGAGKAPGKVIGTGDFADTIICTPAIAGDALYVRSDKKLWKVAGAE
jgi:outer membrane protein assembly factor BamB